VVLLKETAGEEATLDVRVGHLMRIGGYLDYAILSMWTGNKRADVIMGMAAASVRAPGPGGPEGPDEELLARLRDLIAEAREYFEAGDFSAAMARMRVAEDLTALHVIRLTGE